MRNRLIHDSPKVILLQKRLRVYINSSLGNQFAKGIVGSFALRISNVLLSFVISIILARLLGASGYGEYTYAMTWVLILSTIAVFGIDKLSVRNVATYVSEKKWSLLNGFLRWGNKLSITLSILLTITTALIAWYFYSQANDTKFLTLIVAIGALPAIALSRINQAAIRGFFHTVQGQLVETLIRPALFVVLLGGVYLTTQLSNPIIAMGLNHLTFLVGLGFALYFMHRAKSTIEMSGVLERKPRLWYANALPFFMLGILESVNLRVDILILGGVANSEAIGIYNVAKRLAELTTFVLISVNISLAPQIAKLYVNRQINQLQKIVTRSAQLILIGTVPLAFCLIVIGPILLPIWGKDFNGGYSALVILILSQVFNAAMGPVALLLNMTGHERDVALIILLSVIINITLNLLLTPHYSYNGTAIATALSLVFWNIFLVFLVRKRLGIFPTVFRHF